MGAGLDEADVRKLRMSLLWSTVGKTALAKGFCSYIGEAKYLCVCRRTKLPRRGVHSEKVREISWRWAREELVTVDRLLLVLAWTGHYRRGCTRSRCVFWKPVLVSFGQSRVKLTRWTVRRRQHCPTVFTKGRFVHRTQIACFCPQNADCVLPCTRGKGREQQHSGHRSRSSGRKSRPWKRISTAGCCPWSTSHLYMTLTRMWPWTWVGWTTGWEKLKTLRMSVILAVLGSSGQSEWKLASTKMMSNSQVVAMVEKIRKFATEQFIGGLVFRLEGGRQMQKKWRHFWGNARVAWAAWKEEWMKEKEDVKERWRARLSRKATARPPPREGRGNDLMEQPAGVTSSHWPTSPSCSNSVSLRKIRSTSLSVTNSAISVHFSAEGEP